MNKQTNKQAFAELDLNIKYQNIQAKEFTTIGYEYDKGVYVFMLMIPRLGRILK